MGITIAPTGWEGFAEGLLSAGKSIGGGISKRAEMEADAKKKDPLDVFKEMTAVMAAKQAGFTNEQIKAAGLNDFMSSVEPKALEQMQQGGFLTPSVNTPSPIQGAMGQGIPNRVVDYGATAGLKYDPVFDTLREEAAKNQMSLEKESGKEKKAASDTTPIMTDLMNLYIDSLVEREAKYPKSSEATPEGRAGRIMSGIESATMQTLPDTQAFQNIGRKMAYEMARKIEGGRVTDQDVDIVFNSLFNSDMPRVQAMKQANAYINTLRNKGLSEEELLPLSSLVDMSGGQMMEDAKGNRAFVVNGNVIREF